MIKHIIHIIGGECLFGYIKPFREELKVCENELYNSIYCGLCRNMGKTVSQSYRLTLNYDAVFLALVRLAVDISNGTKPEFRRKRCVVHPLKKRNYMIAPEVLSYCSRVFAVLLESKADDDVNDSRGISQFGSKLKRIPLRRYGKKADMTQLGGEIASHLEKMASYEKENIRTPGPLADEFGHILGSVFSFGTESTVNRILYDIGFHTGRWIYIIDACDDFEDDRKKNRFNPFSDCKELPREKISEALTLELEMLSHSVNLLPDSDKAITNIINNIIYLGMPKTAEKILFGSPKQGKELSK